MPAIIIGWTGHRFEPLAVSLRRFFRMRFLLHIHRDEIVFGDHCAAAMQDEVASDWDHLISLVDDGLDRASEIPVNIRYPPDSR
jgi:hypothetical protein